MSGDGVVAEGVRRLFRIDLLTLIAVPSGLVVVQAVFARRGLDTPAEIVIAMVGAVALAACIMAWMIRGTTWRLSRFPAALVGAGFGAFIFWLFSYAYLLPRLIDGERDTDGIRAALLVLKLSGYGAAAGLCAGSFLAFILWTIGARRRVQ